MPCRVEDAVHRGDRDGDPMKPLQIRGDPAGSEVIVLAQVEDLADDLARRGSRRTLRRPGPIAQAGVTMLGMSPLPLVERFPGNPEPTAHAGDVSARRPPAVTPSAARLLTGLAPPSSSPLHSRPISLKRRAECVTLVLRFHKDLGAIQTGQQLLSHVIRDRIVGCLARPGYDCPS